MQNSTVPQPATVRVFVNARPVDIPAGASAIDAVRAWDAAAATAVVAGARLITDSRGLPIGAEAPVSAGSIFRVIAHRAADDFES